MIGSRQRNRQIAVFLAGLALLNFPVLAVVDAIRLPSGAPLAPLYVFVVWLGLILLSAALAIWRPKVG